MTANEVHEPAIHTPGRQKPAQTPNATRGNP